MVIHTLTIFNYGRIYLFARGGMFAGLKAIIAIESGEIFYREMC